MCGCVLKDDISTIRNDLIDTRPKECSEPACTDALEYEMRRINERACWVHGAKKNVLHKLNVRARLR